MVGEAWTVLAGRGAKFSSQRDVRPVFQVGKPGEVGIVEITDIIFSMVGPAEPGKTLGGGAIIVQWNVKEPAGTKAGAGMWDSHILTGGGEFLRVMGWCRSLKIVIHSRCDLPGGGSVPQVWCWWI